MNTRILIVNLMNLHGQCGAWALRVMAAMQNEVVCEHRNCNLEVNPMGDCCTARGGCIAVPDGPGLGVEPDLKVIERFRVG